MESVHSLASTINLFQFSKFFVSALMIVRHEMLQLVIGFHVLHKLIDVRHLQETVICARVLLLENGLNLYFKSQHSVPCPAFMLRHIKVYLFAWF